MKFEMSRIVVAILFALLFIAIGWSAPVMYASYAPQESFMEVNTFEPQNATLDAQSHTICWDRTVHRPASANVILELYHLDDGRRVEVATNDFHTYFEKGDVDGFQQSLPKDLEPGKYQYFLIAEMELADGRVTRVFSWQSEPFYIKNATNVDGPISEEQCNQKT